jgi:outer membrane lipoprotein-sorting protein
VFSKKRNNPKIILLQTPGKIIYKRSGKLRETSSINRTTPGNLLLYSNKKHVYMYKVKSDGCTSPTKGKANEKESST